MKKQGKFFVIPLAVLATIFSFAVLGLALLVKSIVLPSVAHAGITVVPRFTLVCPTDKASVVSAPYFCENPVVEKRIADGDMEAQWAWQALRELRGPNAADPNVMLPILAEALEKSEMTLAWFGTNEHELARAVVAYFAHAADRWLKTAQDSATPLTSERVREVLENLRDSETEALEKVYALFGAAVKEEKAPSSTTPTPPAPKLRNGERLA